MLLNLKYFTQVLETYTTNTHRDALGCISGPRTLYIYLHLNKCLIIYSVLTEEAVQYSVLAIFSKGNMYYH